MGFLVFPISFYIYLYIFLRFSLLPQSFHTTHLTSPAIVLSFLCLFCCIFLKHVCFFCVLFTRCRCHLGLDVRECVSVSAENLEKSLRQMERQLQQLERDLETFASPDDPNDMFLTKMAISFTHACMHACIWLQV